MFEHAETDITYGTAYRMKDENQHSLMYLHSRYLNKEERDNRYLLIILYIAIEKI